MFYYSKSDWYLAIDWYIKSIDPYICCSHFSMKWEEKMWKRFWFSPDFSPENPTSGRSGRGKLPVTSPVGWHRARWRMKPLRWDFSWEIHGNSANSQLDYGNPPFFLRNSDNIRSLYPYNRHFQSQSTFCWPLLNWDHHLIFSKDGKGIIQKLMSLPEPNGTSLAHLWPADVPISHLVHGNSHTAQWIACGYGYHGDQTGNWNILSMRNQDDTILSMQIMERILMDFDVKLCVPHSTPIRLQVSGFLAKDSNFPCSIQIQTPLPSSTAPAGTNSQSQNAKQSSNIQKVAS